MPDSLLFEAIGGLVDSLAVVVRYLIAWDGGQACWVLTVILSIALQWKKSDASG